jgi:hypothetical protein
MWCGRNFQQVPESWSGTPEWCPVANRVLEEETDTEGQTVILESNLWVDPGSRHLPACGLTTPGPQLAPVRSD